MDDPVSRIDPQGLDDGNWLGEMFSNAWQTVKDWWDNSPQPNEKDAIVGTADAAAKLTKQVGGVADTLQKTGMTTADKVGEVLNSPGVKNAGKAVGAVAKGATIVDTARNAADAVSALEDSKVYKEKWEAITKRMNSGTMTDQDLREWENRNWGEPMLKGASAAGKTGVGLMTLP